jgi:hypothetical protein
MCIVFVNLRLLCSVAILKNEIEGDSATLCDSLRTFC